MNALVLLAGPVAFAAPLAQPTLHWVRGTGAEACVTPRALAEQVEGLVGYGLVRAAEAEHSLEGQVQARQEGGFAVRIRVSDGAGKLLGERAFEQQDGDCRRLTPAIAFIIAVLIDPQVAAHGLPPGLSDLFASPEPVEQLLLHELERNPPVPEPATTQRGAAAPHAAPTPVAPSKSPPRVPSRQALLLGQAWLFEAPSVQLGVEAALLGQLASLLSLGGYARVAQQVGSHRYDASASIQLLSMEAGALLCAGHGPRPALRLQGCLGPLVSLIRAVGAGLNENNSAFLAQAGAALLLSLRVRIAGPWGITLSAHGRLAAQAREFTYTDGVGEPQLAARVPAASLGFGLGPSFEF